MADIKTEITNIWKQLFNTADIDDDSNFFILGGTSLHAVKFISMLYKNTGTVIDVQSVFEYPCIGELAEILDSSEKTKSEDIHIVPAPEKQYEPFDLLDTQYAYWVGKNANTELGGIITHCYLELESNYTDPDKMESALNKVIAMHPMLHCNILDTGKQQITEKPEYQKVESKICNTEAEFKSACAVFRKNMEQGHGYLSDNNHFALKMSVYGDKSVIHLLFDATVFDGKSMFIFMHDLKRCLDDENVSFVQPEITFRDYAVSISEIKNTEKYQNDKEYYIPKLEQIKKLPDFYGVKSKVSAIQQHRISHHKFIAEKAKWENFKAFCSENNLTVNSALMELYSEMLALWSNSFDFTLNFTTFDRSLDEYADSLSMMIGDFTKLLLVPVSLENTSSFVSRTKSVMNGIAGAMEHNSFGTIEIERAIAKKSGSKSYSFPIVFTGMVGINSETELAGKITYLSTETSQVWLDMQVVEINDTLEVHFDTAESLFPYEFAENMLEAMEKAFNRLAEDKELWNSNGFTVSSGNYEIREKYNSQTAPLSDGTLDSLFVEQVRKNPDNYAVLSEKKCLTYKELFYYSMSVKQELEKYSDKYIAVMLPKGFEQPVAVMSVLLAGKSYVPVDAKNPVARRQSIMSSVKTDTVITISSLHNDAVEMGARNIIEIDKVTVSEHNLSEYNNVSLPENSAYVIFTSGSTGVPKGVEINHKGALNTILDINRRFNITETDRTIALSNLNFDLSVYDIFGMFCCGGAVTEINPENNRNPEEWIRLIEKFNISVWNSVPAFMQMLLEYTKDKNTSVFLKIKKVLMSGDKIPVYVPDEIHRYNPETLVICLGGATEASIWSNYFIADKVDYSWNMMPYGYPLTNQKYYILDKFMNNCPDYVKGRLYIGGEGLAMDYVGDAEMTAKKFVTHPITKERIYDTGDNGRYWADGTIEFIGRDDFQVKINGHRIELGEIEAIFNSEENIEDCCAVVLSGEHFHNKIAVMIKPVGTDIDTDYLHKLSKEKLPKYMIPAFFKVTESFPVTANGKVDKKTILAELEEYSSEIKSAPTPEKITTLNDDEKVIADMWAEILEEKNFSADDDFFECGGDSLLMIKFLNKLNDTLKIRITPDIFYMGSTISELAQSIKEYRQNGNE